MDEAADKGHLDVILWLLTHRTEGFSSSSMETPLNVEVLYSFDHESTTTESTNDPTQRSQLTELHSVFKLCPAFVEGCLRCVAEAAFDQGHIHILDWLRQFGMKLLSTAPIRRAASRGDLDVVKWSHRNYFEFCKRDLLQLAVRNGRMDVARWLSEHGYEINTPQMVVAAAETKNLTLVRWLIENGRTLDLSTATVLARNDNYVEAMWWVPEPERVQLVLEAMRNENRKLLWWLLMRTRFEEKISHIAISGAIDGAAASMREWLVDNIDDDEVCHWCFPKDEVTASTEGAE
ncbi:hypothetical protein PR001_g28662 [Phytophthora rubi]|uniref:Uncharacterized protein n=1 Tax=Phytophthora rubi TaxID=129364 RepID=A0A6A3H834_9STRA|nr:hypothetical protein PR001_g28662 [Phytophthora rubi]